jgi:cholesterol oxidase
MNRREFVRRTAATAVGAKILNSSANAEATSGDFVPAIVIGSGFGGAVAALRLGEAGVKTVVLERGRRWPIRPAGDTFATFEKPDGRASWLSPMTPIAAIELQFGIQFPPLDIRTGVLETVYGNGMVVQTGAGVGGGSLVYNAITVEPRREIFQKIFPAQIDFDQMQSIYYPRVRSVIGPSPIPQDLLSTPFYQSTRVNLEQAQHAGFNPRPVDLAVDWDIVRDEINQVRVRSIVAGQCWYGNNSGAKKSLDQNYLAMAEQTNNVEILPLHVVTSIHAHSSKLYAVTVNQINEQGKVLATRTLTCRHLFLAAGSIGTSKLLVRAKVKQTLPQLSNQVGRNWAGNGDFLVMRAGLPPTNAGTGGPAGHFLAEYTPPAPLLPICLIEGVTPPHIAQAAASLPIGGIATYIGMGLHQPVGSLTYDPLTDAVGVNFPSPLDLRLLPFIASSQGSFTNTTGGALDTLNRQNPGSFSLAYAPFQALHPLGGATVGAVCDSFGRVTNYPGLYVVDGAFIPGFAGLVNPSLTIAALAERSLERVLAEDIIT